MSIAALIQAAEYIERRDREAEHGYASSLPVYEESRVGGGRRPKTKKSQGSRTTHNELEKNRSVVVYIKREWGRAARRPCHAPPSLARGECM
ncbi:unnamed protein product, partial [Iphiclides podalirius]